MIIHCVGVKGIGLSALAQILVAQGSRMTGSDIAEPFPADDAMRRAGIRIFRGFKASHLPKQCDLVIASNAYLPKQMANSEWRIAKSKPKRKSHTPYTKRYTLNPEILEAIRRGIPIRSYPDVVAELFNPDGGLALNGVEGIAVAGSHGKSTTSALLATTLEALGRDPTAVIGAVVKNWNSNARVSANSEERIAKSKPKRKSHTPYAIGHMPFVLEADEYRNAFHKYHPKFAIITSVDWDHPDVFPTPVSYKKAFEGFVKNIAPKGTLILYGDSTTAEVLRKNARGRRVITYGIGPNNALRLRNIRQTLRGIQFHVSFKNRSLGVFQAFLFGRTQALNAGAVIAGCLTLGENPERIRKALKAFHGTVRRFDILSSDADLRGSKCGSTRIRIRENLRRNSQKSSVIIDDYAHHPTEITAVILAARETFPKRRIRVLFQPHTFSRTRIFLTEFVTALRNADEASILQTYGSARERAKLAGGRSEDLARALGVRHFSTHNRAIAYFKKTLIPLDVLLVVGAGDGDQVARAIAKTKKWR